MFYEWQMDEAWLKGPWPERIKALLMQEPGCGYFPLLGMRQPLKTYETLWGWTDERDVLKWVLMKRRSGNLQLAGSGDGPVSIEVEQLIQSMSFGELIAPASLLTHSFREQTQWQVREGGLLGVLRTPVKTMDPRGLEVRPLEIEALPEVVQLYRKVFKGFTPLEVMAAKLESGEGRGFGIWQNGALISVAQSDFESATRSVIVGVATEPDYQGRGFGGIVLSHLCQVLQEANQSPCLLYDNPDAGILYRKLGFVTEDQVLHIRKK